MPDEHDGTTSLGLREYARESRDNMRYTLSEIAQHIDDKGWRIIFDPSYQILFCGVVAISGYLWGVWLRS